ncbi:two-component system chemotaxis response regulator CheB [Halanaerobium saccharolyticum]|uniref:Protein-glutamate methylesterase/protein-glutamine glutaminase n=1 Tax=Halanaerobium saccharolyticum TaxID=43595 RepID=A0A4R7Z8F9_9FIRM|nr:chemotaxis response regulator protein-glutamate methylesterase [Halanaerobium saccharolyticum]RAK08571.1 two-component system chemotaxis response regulator CheB [Halanaerobium saccharolyticum]TDW07285.1 two-component system chemotaxis response regulator CheB [Halanaerobium saccharolyticum]TDX60123.1 two-component system chemotaxis response regulator CheB [Halanaerobium saccharolyticum]
MLKVLICDDSAFMRKIYSDTIEKDPDLEVAATAYNGQDALRKLKKIDVDLLMLDVEMPKLNGLETLEIVKDKYPKIPVIMVSALDNRETVIKALELGAFDFIPKPSGSISLNIDSIKEELLLKLKAAADSNDTFKAKKVKKRVIKNSSSFPIVAVGASSGGPRALNTLFEDIAENSSAAFVIVQHMPAGFTETLAERLNNISGLKIKEAEEGDTLKPGHGLLAPGDFHLEIDAQGRVKLNKKDRRHGVRPCVDYMMQSLAEHFDGDRLLGVILTGMGHDGAEGMSAIVNKGGYGIIESKETALVYGMPSSAVKAGAYHEIKRIDEIGKRITEIVEG